MQIVWTQTSLRHLSDLQAYIEQDKPEAARRVAAIIAKRSQTWPGFRIWAAPGERLELEELVIAGAPFLVPYRVQGQRLTILAVLHGRQRGPSADR